MEKALLNMWDKTALQITWSQTMKGSIGNASTLNWLWDTNGRKPVQLLQKRSYMAITVRARSSCNFQVVFNVIKACNLGYRPSY